MHTGGLREDSKCLWQHFDKALKIHVRELVTFVKDTGMEVAVGCAGSPESGAPPEFPVTTEGDRRLVVRTEAGNEVTVKALELSEYGPLRDYVRFSLPHDPREYLDIIGHLPDTWMIASTMRQPLYAHFVIEDAALVGYLPPEDTQWGKGWQCEPEPGKPGDWWEPSQVKAEETFTGWARAMRERNP